jgi:membrane protein implicated in regulation of membrane protease activity
MNVQRKKYVAPIIIAVFIALYYSIAAIALYNVDFPFTIKIAVFVVPSIIVIIMMVMVLLERFKEIKKGEDDALGKY